MTFNATTCLQAEQSRLDATRSSGSSRQGGTVLASRRCSRWRTRTQPDLRPQTPGPRGRSPMARGLPTGTREAAGDFPPARPAEQSGAVDSRAGGTLGPGRAWRAEEVVVFLEDPRPPASPCVHSATSSSSTGHCFVAKSLRCRIPESPCFAQALQISLRPRTGLLCRIRYCRLPLLAAMFFTISISTGPICTALLKLASLSWSRQSTDPETASNALDSGLASYISTEHMHSSLRGRIIIRSILRQLTI